MRLLFVVVAGLALIPGTLSSARGPEPREVKVPDLTGLKRSDAEGRLARDGFTYLLPTPRALRYEAVTHGTGRTEEAVIERLAPDRRVVAQEPSVGGSGERGDQIPFATRLPPRAGKRWPYVFRSDLDRATIWPDDRQLTLHFRALARRCQAFDHVDLGLAARYVVVEPSVAGTVASQERCRHGSKRVVHIELPEAVRDRIVVDAVPVRPRGERRHAVVITTFTGNVTRSKWCDLVGVTDLTVVPLRHPLGKRRIVDGARH